MYILSLFLHRSNNETLNYKINSVDVEPLNVSEHTLVYAGMKTEVMRAVRKTVKIVKRVNLKKWDTISYQASIEKIEKTRITNSVHSRFVCYKFQRATT